MKEHQLIEFLGFYWPDKAFTPHTAGTKPTLVTEHNVLEGFKDIFSRLLF